MATDVLTTIPVRESTRAKLQRLKTGGQSYDEVIRAPRFDRELAIALAGSLRTPPESVGDEGQAGPGGGHRL
jgi:hypothetical protein